MQTTLTSSRDERHIRCPRCGVRLPERDLPNHLVIKHGMIYGPNLPSFIMFDDGGRK